MFLLTRRTRRWIVYLSGLFLLFLIFTDVEVEVGSTSSTAGKGHPTPARKRERRITEVWNRPDPADVIPPPLLDRTRLWWGTNVTDVPSTKIRRHVPGWTLVDNVYVFRGTLYIISDDPQLDRIPPVHNMLSSGKPIRREPGDEHRREPTDQNMQVITSRKAVQLFGSSVKRIEGTSFMIYEPAQYFASRFRFAAELLFGIWRTYSTLDTEIESNGQTNLPSPQRILLPNIISTRWRDEHGFIARLLTTLFPSAHVQPAEAWSDYADLPNLAHIFDRVLLADRGAAARGEHWDAPMALLTQRFIASTWWWEPIKRVLLEVAGKADVDASQGAKRKQPGGAQGARATDPEKDEFLVRKDTAKRASGKAKAVNTRPVITYIAAKSSDGRTLHPDDHDDLVRQLNQLEGLYGYSIRVRHGNSLTLRDQAEVGMDSNILVAPHGDGLLPVLWMSGNSPSAIIELSSNDKVDDGHEDYAWTASALNITAYSFYGDSKSYKYPNHPRQTRAKSHSGSHIKIDSKAVVSLCVDILSKA